jgi:resuscitation-promoting factor RpfB
MRVLAIAVSAPLLSLLTAGHATVAFARPTKKRPPIAREEHEEACTPGYDPCIPPGPDVDCAGGSGDGPRYVEGPVRVTGDDVYGLDRDGDGIGCK